MSHQELSGDAPCPCESGKKYQDCCRAKGLEYVVDESGDIYQAIPLSDDLERILEEQQRKFREKYGREMGPDDKLLFDAPTPEHAEHYLVEAMNKAGIDPALIFAFQETGLIVTEENQHLLSDKDVAEWEAAIEQYATREMLEELSDDDEEEDLPF